MSDGQKNHIEMKDDVLIDEGGAETPCKVAVCSCGQGDGMWHYFIVGSKMKLQCVMCATSFEFPS